MGQRRWRLAETHVEGQASTQSRCIEEAQPRQSLRLVAAQLTLESLGRCDGFPRNVLGFVEQVGGPTVALDHDPAAPG